MSKFLNEMLFKLCSSSGDTAKEENAVSVASKYLKDYGEIFINSMGSLIFTLNSNIKKPPIILEAHIDEIAMVVTSVSDDGFVRAAASGGIDRHILPSSEVIIHCKIEVLGIVCSTPPHLSKGEAKPLPVDEILIDTGLSHLAKELICLGDRVTLKSSPTMLLNDRVCAKSLDNRSGVAALIYAIKLISDKNPPPVTVILAVQEELGERGIAPAAYKTPASEALVVDVSFAMTPDSDKLKCGELDKGPMIGISPVLDKNISNTLIKIAKQKDIPYQLEIMAKGTGTDADTLSLVGMGIPCGLISIPQRYMHTSVEVCSLKDIENLSKLIAKYILRSEKNV
jgi:putative aminopeptidase FrvX